MGIFHSTAMKYHENEFSLSNCLIEISISIYINTFKAVEKDRKINGVVEMSMD